MVHLGPLPGAPHPADLGDTIRRAVEDARSLADAGFGGVFVENYGDVPFHPGRVPAITIAVMTRVASALRAVLPSDVQLGVNVLRNDAQAALAVAAASGASAIRVNVHCGARVTDQGVIEGEAWQTMRLRAAWQADVAVWADVAVKHSTPLGPGRPLAEDVADLVERGSADAVIVTGPGTGLQVSAEALAVAVSAAGAVPVYVGSGASEATVEALLAVAHGVIVGTALKRDGVTTAPVDPARAQAFVRAANLR
jgi:membrane complex biogenesis BtpA family protein